MDLELFNFKIVKKGIDRLIYFKALKVIIKKNLVKIILCYRMQSNDTVAEKK